MAQLFKLDSKGRCCGRKPIVYKRYPHLFCCRCNRGFDPVTQEQIVNWAWVRLADGSFKLKEKKA